MKRDYKVKFSGKGKIDMASFGGAKTLLEKIIIHQSNK